MTTLPVADRAALDAAIALSKDVERASQDDLRAACVVLWTSPDAYYTGRPECEARQRIEAARR
jgi:hypothetical protein